MTPKLDLLYLLSIHFELCRGIPIQQSALPLIYIPCEEQMVSNECKRTSKIDINYQPLENKKSFTGTFFLQHPINVMIKKYQRTYVFMTNKSCFFCRYSTFETVNVYLSTHQLSNHT